MEDLEGRMQTAQSMLKTCLKANDGSRYPEHLLQIVMHLNGEFV